MEHWSIQNCVDESCCIIQRIEAIAWHGLKNTDNRTKKEMKDDFDKIIVEMRNLRKCIGVWR